MKTVELTKKERDRLIKDISSASGVAQYALKEKMKDEQIVKAAQHLEILALVKDANNFNRYKQGLKTQEANEKLKAFLNPQHSEILNAGKWLLNVLSKSGSDRKQVLLEKDLVHKQDYNETVQELRNAVTDITGISEETTTEAETKISELEKRIDTLKGQLSKIQEYIAFNYGKKEWQVLKKTFNLD
ncbi:hypothetical protein [Pseudanabaena sp. FACHB-2040]|uniref:hypothetical protein n=1 Tax=Pseudanabaena sp. FACHB-2040 TaxID=2692859 RepID=UPI001684EA51|nr:hypothetical protein [Pseudanabaena sp. FACHB-2040]MBD2256364.1 hypothetical protein [Pseudanabaena sp. FACHB-2040]